MNHRLVSVSLRGGWKVLSAPIVLLMQSSDLFSLLASLLIVTIIYFRVIHRYRSCCRVQLLSVNYLALLCANYCISMVWGFLSTDYRYYV
ncbi:hypothetical protein ARMGADRAFT_483826 [Armillaria gallica]|uniref:Uncharacterized protein n=1 Tax=Armillaria gallica TaxID=47427 RepID=A0A2H3EC82_ARMGA|nr:hypothetical protein ARMGADRAFT_483826 [Armillaria gallica]